MFSVPALSAKSRAIILLISEINFPLFLLLSFRQEALSLLFGISIFPSGNTKFALVFCFSRGVSLVLVFVRLCGRSSWVGVRLGFWVLARDLDLVRSGSCSQCSSLFLVRCWLFFLYVLVLSVLACQL